MSADGCACPQHHARGCYRARQKLDMREALGGGLTSDASSEECSCSCHEEEEDDFADRSAAEEIDFLMAATDADAWLDERREVF